MMNRPEKIKDLIRAACRTGSGGSDWTAADERILSDAAAAMKQTHTGNLRVARIHVWRKIMESKMTRYSAAAVVALAAALVLMSPFGTSKQGVALAAVQEKMTQVDTMILKGEKVFTSVDDPNISYRIDVVKYISHQYGYVEEARLNGSLVYRITMNTPEKQNIMVFPLWKKCLRRPCTEEQIQIMEKLTPYGVVDLLLQTNHKKLGQGSIDGIDVEGFELPDMELVKKGVPKWLLDIQQGTVTVWVTTKDLLPIRIESDMLVGKTFTTLLMDWRLHEVNTLDSYNIELSPELFNTEIPEGYTEWKLTDFIPIRLSLAGLGILPVGCIAWRRIRRNKATRVPTE
jgi:hypothetical protein